MSQGDEFELQRGTATHTEREQGVVSSDPKDTRPAPNPERLSSQADRSAGRRIALPQSLPETIRFIDDADLETLRLTVEAEIIRRRSAVAAQAGHSVASGAAPSQVEKRKPRANEQIADVPMGKASLIKASYQAGMKPNSIARSLRVSLSTVNKVLGLQATAKR